MSTQSGLTWLALLALVDFLATELVARHMLHEDMQFFPLLAGHAAAPPLQNQ